MGAVGPWRATPTLLSRQQMAVAVSAGIPTSQGSQYLENLPPICMSQGWTNSAAPRSSHVLGRWMIYITILI